VLAATAILTILSAPLLAQTAHPMAPASTTPAKFDVADIHNSYHRYGGYVNGGDLVGDRYFLRQATMLDLIGTAYGVDRDHIFLGPEWMEADRFDLLAKAPAGTSKERVTQMLQTLLADRFKLAVHTDTKVMPAYVLSVGKGVPKLKQADASDKDTQGGCGVRSASTGPVQVGPGLPPPQAILFCNSVTMKSFAETLHSFFGDELGSAVVDSTGLKGAWNLEMRIAWSDTITAAQVVDAVKNQLGMKFESAKVPQRVIVVDRVERKPTPNPPEVATQLPRADLQFDVAVIHPAAPKTKHTNVQINGHEAILNGTTMQFLIMLSYDVNEATLVDIPPWFLSTRWDITAKAPIDPASKNPEVDMEDVKVMLRSLLADRFKLKMHTETRPADGMVLVAAGPKLKKSAETDIRPTCVVGPGPDGKNPGIANPILTGLITCRNISMAEFADRLSTVLSNDFKTPVVDGTGLTGRYDFQLSYTKDMRAATATPIVRPKAMAAAEADGTDGAADPNGAISLMDAFPRQLGLKFEQQKRPTQVLVLDHIEETPTEN
jgi:uncharacterized protein (TIGR03435 family)